MEAMGWSKGVRKMSEMCKNWENGQKWAKNKGKKNEKFLEILPAINATILHTLTYTQK